VLQRAQQAGNAAPSEEEKSNIGRGGTRSLTPQLCRDGNYRGRE
jgi:hypothetical protein